ncbi:MAG: HlyD family secretion protein [Candidatus Gastranaerophilales bacterium]|nr:HlyD family secretion protein [Candidatus Gastranaerophilales bacterium]
MSKKNILISSAVAILLIVFFYFLNNFLYYSTTKARIKYNIENITAKIDGNVSLIKIENNTEVKKGEILVQLEQEDIKKELENAKKELQEAQNKLNENSNKIKFIASQAKNNIEDAKLKLENANNDYTIYKNSYKDGTVTKNDLDNATKNLALAKENYENVQKNIELAKESLEVNQNINETQNEEIQNLTKKIEELELKLSYSTFIAPFDGKIKKINVKLNQEVKTDDKILTIISNDYYIKAKFKKAKLSKIKENQEVLISITPYKQIKGFVKNIDTNKNIVIIQPKEFDSEKKLKHNKKVFIKIKVN